MLVVIGALAVIDRLGRPIARAAMPVRAVGVTLDPGPGGEAQAYHLFLRAGANGIEAPQPWSTLEPTAGRFRLTDVRSIVDGVRLSPGMRIMLIPAAIETTDRTVPSGLRHAPWTAGR